MRLTVKMLEAMQCALCELLAGEVPQGVDEDSDEALQIMDNADKASMWVAQEIHRRGQKSKRLTRKGSP